ncbi:phosphomannomutase [Colwellia sp. E2M01]|uniref:phosphomannomutase n=1 Tax=Colwellia sp. E2M01 TaxID=2841561 RepID=UPI001C083E3A|nr:phosphomannomutase [Colwellia sp. E2M01]MBU2870046.1 phosphomannomutase [Colwellia sp. E2M01]
MKNLITKEALAQSGVAFGTSGARGLVEQFTADVCAAFAVAFVDAIKDEFSFSTLAIAIDNRPSSYAMAQACSAALEELGITTFYYGVIPTPALAYAAMQRNIPCIMVTGSHIPFDRNGLKFYRPDGEITKLDEQAILNSTATFDSLIVNDESTSLAELVIDKAAGEEYLARYLSLFEQPFLAGKHIGIYEHSSAGRDLYQPLFEKLGATVTSLERSDVFVPIDTEAVSDEDKAKAKAWSEQYKFDAIFSTDGDGDRPLIADEKGNWLRGDILGLLCAKALGVDALAVPVSSNTSIELSRAFKQVDRTRIGSPYVIAEFARLAKSFESVAGFEANGGFLLGSDTIINGKTLKALPTRDAVLPAIMLLAASIESGNISSLVEACSLRFSASDRIQNFATEKSQSYIAAYSKAPYALIKLLGFDEISVLKTDVTDGLRITMSNNDIIHLRPSGNAPELRCYAESDNEVTAQTLVVQVLAKMSTL